MATDVEQPALKKKSPRTLITVLLLIAAGVFVWWWKFDTYHYIEVQDGVLYRDGNQDLRRFSTALRKAEPKTIVPLIDAEELADPEKPQFKDEENFAAEKGIKVEPVRVKLGGWPNTEDVRKFLAIAEKKENQPVLVHCAQGVRRTGMMVAAYQMSILGWSKEKANTEIETFGHSERSIGDVRKFIDAYDPATRTVTKEFAMSNE